VLTGEAAAAYRRGLLESAGIVEVVERSVGRPRIGGSYAPKGVRSPRGNMAISDQIDELLDQLGKRRGVSAANWYVRPRTPTCDRPSDRAGATHDNDVKARWSREAAAECSRYSAT